MRNIASSSPDLDTSAAPSPQRFVRADGRRQLGPRATATRPQKVRAIGVTPVPGDPRRHLGGSACCGHGDHAASERHRRVGHGPPSARSVPRRLAWTAGSPRCYTRAASGCTRRRRPCDRSRPSAQAARVISGGVTARGDRVDLSAHDVSTIIRVPAWLHGESRGIFGMWFDDDAMQEDVSRIPATVRSTGRACTARIVARRTRSRWSTGKGGERYLLADESHHIGEAARRSGGRRRGCDGAVAAGRGRR